MLIAGGGRGGRGGRPDRRIAAGAGALYAGAAMLAPALLRGSPTQGLAAMLWLYAVVWGTDIGAYFGGRTDRRAEAVAGDLAGQDLVRRARRRRRLGRSWRAVRGLDGSRRRRPRRCWSSGS